MPIDSMREHMPASWPTALGLGVVYLGHISQADVTAFAAGNHQGTEVFHGLEFASHPHRQLVVLRADLASRVVTVGRSDGVRHLANRQAQRLQPVRQHQKMTGFLGRDPQPVGCKGVFGAGEVTSCGVRNAPWDAVAAMTALLTLVLKLRPWHLARSEHALAWGVLAVIGLHSLLEYPLWYGPFQISTLLCAWLLWPTGPSLARRGAAVLRLSGWVVLALSSLIAADYWRMRQIYLPSTERLGLWRNNPWEASRHTVFFEPAYRFAQLTTTPVSAGNAVWVLDTSLALLHYSPEPRIVHAVIDSARLLGRQDLATLHQQRLKQAYPQDQHESEAAPAAEASR